MIARTHLIWTLVGLAGFATLAGCQKAPPPEFRFDRVDWLKQEKLHLNQGESFSADYPSEIGQIMETLFGTPEHAWFPFAESNSPQRPIVSPDNLTLAAGAVASNEDGHPAGLYREHCAECHGISGDGAGPMAGLLYPYPRDFRLGKFKFKSTPQRHPPTDADLRRTLDYGIPGTAMPSFQRLSEAERDALVDYVKYLSIRGNFEKYLIIEVPVLDDQPFLDVDYAKTLPEPVSRERPSVSFFSKDPVAESQAVPNLNLPQRRQAATELASYLAELMGDQFQEFVVERWAADDANVTEVPPGPASMTTDHPDYPDLVERGRQLFLAKGGCVQCHGKDATGVGDVENNYDDWTNNWLKSPGVDPTDRSTYRDFREAGALKPRVVSPRNLRLGVYRGGSQPDQLYRRIANGIEGTPMPAATALADDEIWALVAYVLALRYDTGQEGGSEQ